MKKTNFDRYMDEQMRDPAFAARFERAGQALDDPDHHFNAEALIRSVEETRDHLRGARKIALRQTAVSCPTSGDTSAPDDRMPHAGRLAAAPGRRQR